MKFGYTKEKYAALVEMGREELGSYEF